MSGESHQRRTRIDLSTVDDPGCREVLDKYEIAGVAVFVWDITSEIGVPAFSCTIVDQDPNPNRPIAPMGGYGCHPSRGVALLRALTEAAQSRLTVITGARDDVRADAGGPDEDFLAARLFLEKHGGKPAHRDYHDTPDYTSDAFDEDVTWELDRLRAAGFYQVVAIDLTRPEFGISVVRVVIPGLEPLYDIPGYVPGARARRRLQEGAL